MLKNKAQLVESENLCKRELLKKREILERTVSKGLEGLEGLKVEGLVVGG